MKVSIVGSVIATCLMVIADPITTALVMAYVVRVMEESAARPPR